MVDEAHGVGVLGADGTGACEVFGVADRVDLRMGTFCKSLASCGGFISGPTEVIDFLRVQSRAFMFTASAVPAAVGATLAALRVIRSDEGRELLARVLDNARYLQKGLDDRGFDVVQPTPMPDGSDLLTPIVPVTIGDDWQAVLFWRALYDEGVYANVALYPAVPRGGALLRTSVMATHERSHLDRGAGGLREGPQAVDGLLRRPGARLILGGRVAGASGRQKRWMNLRCRARRRTVTLRTSVLPPARDLPCEHRVHAARPWRLWRSSSSSTCARAPERVGHGLALGRTRRDELAVHERQQRVALRRVGRVERGQVTDRRAVVVGGLPDGDLVVHGGSSA